METSYLQGELFEIEFRDEFKWVSNAEIIMPLILPAKNTKYKFQIDAIVLSTTGIYVVELKYYTTTYKGNLGSKEIESIFTGTKVKNPVYQNKLHIRALYEVIGKSVDFKNIIVYKGNKPDINFNDIYDLSEFVDKVSYSAPIYTEEYLDTLKKKLIKYKSKSKDSYHY